MTKIESAYNSIIEACNDLYPMKSRLHNPYTLEENPDVIKKDSWGIRTNGANREEQDLCNLSLNRSFTFILIRQLVSLAGKEDGFDSITVKLLNDQQSFLERFYKSDNLGNLDNIDLVEIGDVSGIQSLVTDEKKYLFCEITFSIITSTTI